MKTIAIISHKGGAGKTSSAVMLAEELVRRGARVVLVDADRQRGAGLLLGLDQSGTGVQQTSNPRLRYFCSSGLPLRELPARAEELRGLFDVAVVDTPSLDDPLARAWIQLSTAALMVLPVEPVSVKTLDGADSALEAIRKLNPQIQELGVLPTMFDEEDATQRTLMLELRARRADCLLEPPIPHDANLAHRAEQKAERRTTPGANTIQAYQSAGETIAQLIGLDGVAPPRTFVAPSGFKPAGARAAAPATGGDRPAGREPAPAPAPSAPLLPANAASSLRWALAAAVALALLVLGLGWFLKGRHGQAASHAGNQPALRASMEQASLQPLPTVRA